MKKLVINQTLTGKLLEGFHEMDSGELIKFYGSDANRCGLYDEERHMAVIVSWNKPKLLGFLADERAAVKGAEARFRRNLQNYRHVDTLNRKIAGRQAVGVRFEYNPDGTDIVQYGELYAPIHYIECNKLTPSSYDKYSREPNYKGGTCRFEKVKKEG